ncbi:hypothetical protein ACFORG_14260 [Lutimaribacter marinistellae]|uniref:Ca-activated chloride channel family protein n=1 Tax=Lutimaribacter marinistellae TaxID=1820329 RepID=A0ABV7TJ57_9RHOB
MPRIHSLALLSCLLPGVAFAQSPAGENVPQAKTETTTELQATLSHPDRAEGGSTLDIDWSGPGADGDLITLSVAGTGRPLAQAYTRKGNPARIVLPPEPGTYELRYLTAKGKVLATNPLGVTAPILNLSYPAEVAAGTSFDVAWRGPGQGADTIRIGPPDSPDQSHLAYIRSGNPARLIAPTNPGTYEIRYVFRDGQVLLTRPLTVTATPLGLDAPRRVPAGSKFAVTWKGPDQTGDIIEIASPGNGAPTDYAYTRSGNPASLFAPTTPGLYELRYRFRNRETLVAQPITVTAIDLSLDFPEEVPAGARFKVTWQGPGQPSDNIQISSPGDEEYEDYAYLTLGNPVELVAPARAGTYELRYLFRDDEVLIARPITVTPVPVKLDHPATIPGGSSFAVAWSGPNQRGDTVQIARPDDPADDGLTYAFMQDAAPVRMIAPLRPGSYEVRYVFQDEEVLLRQPLEVTAPDLALFAPDRVAPGESFEVEWVGPDQPGDTIQIRQRGERARDFAYVRGRNPVTFTAPDTPGTYELRYMFLGDEVAIRRQIIVAE